MHILKCHFKWVLTGIFLIFYVAGCTAGNKHVPDNKPLSPTDFPTLTQRPITRTAEPYTATPTEHPKASKTPTPSKTSKFQYLNTETNVPSIRVTNAPAQYRSPTINLKNFGFGSIAYAEWFGNHGIYTIPIDGRNLKWVTEAYNPLGFYDSPSWSPDGHWLTFASNFESTVHGGPEKIYITKLDGTAIKLVSQGSGTDPVWSPDGKRIAYSTYGNICVISIDNFVEKCLTYTPLGEQYPTWSLDGRQIAFLYEREDPKNNPGAEIYMMDADGSNRRKITDFLASWGRIAWSPDGKHIAFSSWSGCGDIYLVDVENGSLRQLTNSTGREKSPTWSPDGKYIAYNYATITCEQMSGGGPAIGWSIYIITADGTSKVELVRKSKGYPLDPAWSPVPALQIGVIYRITTAGANLNLRESPSLSVKVLEKLGEGDQITILEGPVDRDDYYWWRMRTADGVKGWAVEVSGWYAPVSAEAMPILTPTP